MPDKDPKLAALRQQGTLNPRPGRVSDALFVKDSFFDSRDLVQVKYEMLRRVQAENHSVAIGACELIEVPSDTLPMHQSGDVSAGEIRKFSGAGCGCQYGLSAPKRKSHRVNRVTSDNTCSCNYRLVPRSASGYLPNPWGLLECVRPEK